MFIWNCNYYTASTDCQTETPKRAPKPQNPLKSESVVWLIINLIQVFRWSKSQISVRSTIRIQASTQRKVRDSSTSSKESFKMKMITIHSSTWKMLSWRSIAYLNQSDLQKWSFSNLGLKIRTISLIILRSGTKVRQSLQNIWDLYYTHIYRGTQKFLR